MDCTPKTIVDLDCGLHSKNAGVSNALVVKFTDLYHLTLQKIPEVAQNVFNLLELLATCTYRQ